MTPQEHDTELANLIAERAALLARQRRGEDHATEIRCLTDCITYTETHADWPRYYRRHEGAIHTRPKCSGMTRPGVLIPAWSGLTPVAVADYGHVCGHCRLG